MYEYSYSLKCRLCGQRIIVTNTELAHHIAHCPGLLESSCNYLKQEKNSAPIRQYNKNKGTGLVLVAMDETTHTYVGSVFVVDSKTVVGEFMESPLMKSFLEISRNKKNLQPADKEIVSVGFLAPNEMQEAIYNGTMLEAFQHASMIRVEIIIGSKPHYLTFKLVTTFERNSSEMFEPILVAQGLIPARDFYSLGFEVDRFCNDPVSAKNAAWIAYANELIRHAEPVISLAMGINAGEEIDDFNMMCNYIPEALANRFYSLMANNMDCRNRSLEELISKEKDSNLRVFVQRYTRQKNMRKAQKVEFITTGQHVEKALTEQINGYQFQCLREIMEKGGYEYCGEECDTSYLDLFEKYLLLPGTDENDERMVYIPKEYMFIFKRVLYNKEVEQKMERMSLMDNRLNGIVYAYGILPWMELYRIYVDLYGNPFNEINKVEDQFSFMTYVTRTYAVWHNRDSVADLYITDDDLFVYHEKLEYPGEIRYYKKPSPMKTPFKAEIDAMGEKDYMEYNEELERISINLLANVDNKDETTLQMLNYYIYSTMLYGIKQGFPPEEVFENVVRLMPVPADDLMHVLNALCKEADNIARWDIGGFSSKELKEHKKQKGKVQKITMR